MVKMMKSRKDEKDNFQIKIYIPSKIVWSENLFGNVRARCCTLILSLLFKIKLQKW